MAGQLRFDDAQPAATTQLELADERGNVVRRAQTARSGRARFRNLESGRRFSVRVNRAGFQPAAAPVQSAAGRSEAADIDLARH